MQALLEWRGAVPDSQFLTTLAEEFRKGILLGEPLNGNQRAILLQKLSNEIVEIKKTLKIGQEQETITQFKRNIKRAINNLHDIDEAATLNFNNLMLQEGNTKEKIMEASDLTLSNRAENLKIWFRKYKPILGDICELLIILTFNTKATDILNKIRS